MTNRPYSSEFTNILNETTYHTDPAAFGFNNVTATQAQKRSIFDTVSTSIAANPQPQMIPCSCACCTQPAQILQAQPQYMPGGVSFTFSPPAQQNYIPQTFSSQVNRQQFLQPNQFSPPPSPQAQLLQEYQLQPNQFIPPPIPQTQIQQDYQFQPNQFIPPPIPQTQVQQDYQLQPNQFSPPPQPQTQAYQYQQPLTLQQQIALKQLEREGLELMLLQEHLKKNPYKLQFHMNSQTSTTDLLKGPSQVPISRGMPDIKNLLGSMADYTKDVEKLGETSLPNEKPPNILYPETSKAKMLMLTKSPDLQAQKVDKKNLYLDVSEYECPDAVKNQATAQDQDKSNQESNSTKRVSFDDDKSHQESNSTKQVSVDQDKSHQENKSTKRDNLCKKSKARRGKSKARRRKSKGRNSRSNRKRSRSSSSYSTSSTGSSEQ